MSAVVTTLLVLAAVVAVIVTMLAGWMYTALDAEGREEDET